MFEQLSDILKATSDSQGSYVLFQCPGCNLVHRVKVEGPGAWGYNNDANKPTFTPSVLVTYSGCDAGENGAPPSACHSFITDGRIQYLNDSTHALAGQTVDLPVWSTDPLLATN